MNHQQCARDTNRCILQRKFTENVDCGFCLNNMSGKLVRWLPCGHVFDNKCFLKHLLSKRDCSKYNCPLCKKNVYNSLPEYEKIYNLINLPVQHSELNDSCINDDLTTDYETDETDKTDETDNNEDQTDEEANPE
tara:strand:+ start:463 stop:867 length:405 start_codon:yes stop_codon:yes gene_type:complete